MRISAASTVGKQPFNFKALRSHWMHVTCFPSYNKRAMSVFCEHFFYISIVASCCLAAGACSSGPIKQLSTPNPLIFRCLSCYYGSAHPQDFFHSREKKEKKKKRNHKPRRTHNCFCQDAAVASHSLAPSESILPSCVFRDQSIRFLIFLHSYSQMLCTEATAAK